MASFSASCKALRFLSTSCGTAEAVPFQKPGFHHRLLMAELLCAPQVHAKQEIPCTGEKAMKSTKRLIALAALPIPGAPAA
jgi:hypothetical protein